MRNFYTWIFAIVYLNFVCISQAQTYVPDHTTLVKNNSEYALYPFAGGLNTPQFCEIDLNQDGKKDLAIFDRTGNKILTFINNGSAGNVDYVYWPEYESIFPPMQNFAVFIDYTCDGIEDIMTSYDNGIKIYKAVYDGYSLHYEEAITKLTFTEAGFTQDLGVGYIDIPGFADVNSDGDIDVLTFNLAGGVVDYYENMQIENGEDCGVWDLQHVNACWGNFFESGLFKTKILNYTCKGVTSQKAEDGMHAGSTFMIFDEDADGDQDIVLGDLSFNNLSFLTNGGDENYANITDQDSSYPVYTVPANVPIFPAPFLIDVNNDGKKDMLVSPNNLNLSENFKNVWYYENISPDDTYQFAFKTDSFLVNDMVDVGEGANPVFFDYNHDGLMDIVIGNYGYYEPGANYKGTLTLYENTGTANTPEYSLITRDWAGISAFNFNALYPAFADLDNDGDNDMLLGESNGFVHYFKNIAPAGSDAEFVLFAAEFEGIDDGQYSTPQLIDVNEDGLVDLIMGETNGNLNYYENTGTPESPIFELQNDFWGNVDVRVAGSITGHSTPYLFKNNSGNWQLLCGSENGTIVQYEPTPDFAGAFTKITESFSNIDEGSNSSVQFLDITNDGIPELITGNYRGGISLYHDATVLPVNSFNNTNSFIQIYPNPASHILNINIYAAQNIHSIILSDITGKKINEYFTESKQLLSLDVAQMHAGIYILQFADNNGNVVQARKFIKL